MLSLSGKTYFLQTVASSCKSSGIAKPSSSPLGNVWSIIKLNTQKITKVFSKRLRPKITTTKLLTPRALCFSKEELTYNKLISAQITPDLQ